VRRKPDNDVEAAANRESAFVGTAFRVEVTARGMIGELTKAQLRQPDGSWIDLEERQPQAE